MSFLSIDFRPARRETMRQEDSTMPVLSDASRAVQEPPAAPSLIMPPVVVAL